MARIEKTTERLFIPVRNPQEVLAYLVQQLAVDFFAQVMIALLASNQADRDRQLAELKVPNDQYHRFEQFPALVVLKALPAYRFMFYPSSTGQQVAYLPRETHEVLATSIDTDHPNVIPLSQHTGLLHPANVIFAGLLALVK